MPKPNSTPAALKTDVAVEKIWMRLPFEGQEPIEVEATHDTLVPLMVQGYTQCPAPSTPAVTAIPVPEPAPEPAPVIEPAL